MAVAEHAICLVSALLELPGHVQAGPSGLLHGRRRSRLVATCRTIILLESNIGQSTLHQMLVQAGVRSKVSLLVQFGAACIQTPMLFDCSDAL